jgi:hypothetical protein
MTTEAAPNVEGLVRSTDFVINTLTLVTSDGVVTDIDPFAVEVNLYEDIFSPCMSGSILMGDALDLIDHLKLHGNEFLIMEIDKPSLKQPVRKVFRVYKISNREYTTNTLQNYILHFCSEELVLSTQKYMSKSYKGMVVSDMVKDILINQLQTGTSKLARLETTEGIFNIVLPRMQPFEAIEWLASRAYSSDGSLFFFFENRDGFNFISYETLMKNPVYQTYYYAPKTGTSPQDNLNRINFLKVIQDFDVIASGRYGAYSATLMTYDFTSGKTVGHNSTMTQYKKLNKGLPINDSKNRFNSTLTGNPEYFLKFHPTASDPTVNNHHPENWLHKKASKLAQIHTFKMIATIPGDVMLKVGSIIEVELPQAIPQSTRESSEFRSGKYLVSALHHVFVNGIMTTTLELLSDSMGGMLNASADTSPTIQALRKS